MQSREEWKEGDVTYVLTIDTAKAKDGLGFFVLETRGIIDDGEYMPEWEDSVDLSESIRQNFDAMAKALGKS